MERGVLVADFLGHYVSSFAMCSVFMAFVLEMLGFPLSFSFFVILPFLALLLSICW